MQITLPIIMIAAGGLALITQRNRLVIVGALLVQWVGMSLQIASLPPGTTGELIEIVVAVASCAILGLTSLRLDRPTQGRQFAFRTFVRNRPARNSIADQLWLWAIALVAGVGGIALSQVYPLGGSSQDLLAFYWILLPAMLALVVDGSRDPTKLASGLLSLFNTALFLVYALGATSPGVTFYGLAALCRLALASIAGYSWLLIKESYHDFNLNSLFDMRDGKLATGTALAVIPDQPVETAVMLAPDEEEAEGTDADAE